MTVFERFASLPVRLTVLLVVLGCIALVAVTAGFALQQVDSVAQPAANALVQAIGLERAEVLNKAANALTASLRKLHAEALPYLEPLLIPDRQAATIQALEGMFRAAMNSDRVVTQVQVVGVDGTLLASFPSAATQTISDQPYFQALRKTTSTPETPFISYLTNSKSAVMAAALNGRNGGAQAYVLLTVTTTGDDPATTYLYDALETANYSTGSVIFYLISADQSNPVESPFLAPAAPNEVTLLSAQSLMSQNMTRTALLTSPLTGQTALMFAAPVRAFNKWLVAEGRSLQLGGGSDLGQFAAQLLLLFTVGLAVLALLWWQVDHRVLRPLSKLAERANRAVQDGAVGEFPLIQPHGEIGAVNRALHMVTSQLQHNAEQFETRISESLRTLDTIREVGQIISSMRDLDPLLNRAVALIQERFSRIYHVQVFLNDDRHEYAALRVSTGDIGRQLLARGHRLAVGSQSVIGRVTAEGRPVVALDTERTAFHRKNELLPDTRSELALPLRTVEGVIGALDVQSRLPDAFSEADIRLLQGIADQLAITIVNARLFQATRTQLAEIEHLNRRLLSESWQSFTDVRRRQAVESMSQPWSELQKRAMVTGTLVEQFSDDLVTFAVPVSLRGIVLGAVEWDMPRRQYSDDIRQLALELADRLAITADNARLFEETQQTAERERLVNEISARLTQQTDVSSILQIAVRDLGQALRVPQTAIRLGSSKPASQS